MKARHIILLLAMFVELFLFFYCLIRKSNHVTAGYICAIGSLFLFICTGWLLLFPKVVPIKTTGPFKVKTEDTFYTDLSRLESYADNKCNRELPVTFWYPEEYSDSFDCPIIIFSHGSLGIRTSNETLYRELASHGYVVCSIDHTYQCFSTKLSSGKKVLVSGAFMKELSSDDPHKHPEQSVIHWNKWMTTRCDDINFVLDTILTKVKENNQDLSVYHLIDTSRIGVMGHSLGGSAALGIGRQRDDISVVIALEAPFLCDIKAANEDGSFVFEESDYPVPVLNIYSDSSYEHLNEWKQYEENYKLLQSQSEDVKNVYMKGIGHFSLTDLSLTSPFLTTVFNGGSSKIKPEKALKEINELCLPFFDRYLK